MESLTALHCLAADYPGLRILICRATRASLTESVLVTYEQEILHADGMEAIAAGCLRRVRQSYLYPHGSEIVVGGLDRPAKIFSTSWDLIYVNEAIEVTEDAWEALASRLRRPGRAAWLGYMIGDTNPGDPAHWLRRRAIDGHTALWDTLHAANPRLHTGRTWTREGLAYLQQLQRLTGSRRKRLLDGLWAAGEGAWFDGFDATTHVSDAADYSRDLPVYLAIDSGPHSAAVWLQFGSPGVRVIGDYYSFNRGAHAVARDLIGRSALLCGGRVDFASTDPAGRSSTAIGVTVFEEYARAGLKVHAWPLRTVLDSLASWNPSSRSPHPELIVHPRCTHLIDAMANYKRAKRANQWIEKPEDPQHPYEDLVDALRGGLADKFPDGRKHFRPYAGAHMSRVF